MNKKTLLVYFYMFSMFIFMKVLVSLKENQVKDEFTYWLVDKFSIGDDTILFAAAIFFLFSKFKFIFKLKLEMDIRVGWVELVFRYGYVMGWNRFIAHHICSSTSDKFYCMLYNVQCTYIHVSTIYSLCWTTLSCASVMATANTRISCNMDTTLCMLGSCIQTTQHTRFKSQ